MKIKVGNPGTGLAFSITNTVTIMDASCLILKIEDEAPSTHTELGLRVTPTELLVLSKMFAEAATAARKGELI